MALVRCAKTDICSRICASGSSSRPFSPTTRPLGSAPPIFTRAGHMLLKRKMKVLFVFAALFVAQTAAHLCLIFPHQRGSMQGLNVTGSKDCFLMDKPCGNRSASPLFTSFKHGGNYSIVFQKNLNHFNKSSPGKFVVKLGKYDPAGTVFDTELLSFPDTDTPSLTIYTPFVIMPEKFIFTGVLQVTYVNSDPGTFYQCADIAVV